MRRRTAVIEIEASRSRSNIVAIAGLNRAVASDWSEIATYIREIAANRAEIRDYSREIQGDGLEITSNQMVMTGMGD